MTKSELINFARQYNLSEGYDSKFYYQDKLIGEYGTYIYFKEGTTECVMLYYIDFYGKVLHTFDYEDAVKEMNKMICMLKEMKIWKMKHEIDKDFE